MNSSTALASVLICIGFLLSLHAFGDMDHEKYRRKTDMLRSLWDPGFRDPPDLFATAGSLSILAGCLVLWLS